MNLLCWRARERERCGLAPTVTRDMNGSMGNFWSTVRFTSESMGLQLSRGTYLFPHRLPLAL